MLDPAMQRIALREMHDEAERLRIKVCNVVSHDPHVAEMLALADLKIQEVKLGLRRCLQLLEQPFSQEKEIGAA